MLPSGLDDATGGSVDDGGNATGLSVEGIHGRHGALLLSCRKRVSIAEYSSGFSAFHGGD
jgi:hypothetical protein